ncbi:zinc finger protein 711-like [Zophobas morio]|uniref:zinc finger protein 711-like n=1 Tax=Zophobas morio TaxID=2755281 RepID=UPI003083855A
MAHSKQTCSVFNCSSIRKKNPDLSFHLFPKEDEKIRVLNDFGIAEVCDRRKLWGMKLKIEKKINNSMAVCSRHFTQDDYECSGWSSQNRLKPTAVPSRNLPSSTLDITTALIDSGHFMMNYVKRRQVRVRQFNCEIENIEIYSCKYCLFQTEISILFKQHIQDHDSVKRDKIRENYTVKTYICKKCQFETYFALKWLQHTATCVVKKKNQIINTKCQNCPDEIKEKSTVSVQSSIKWHQCEKCPFHTTHKGTLKNHIIARHLNAEDIKWYKCEECPFQTKMKGNLKLHVIARHLNEEDIKWYKCKKCPYKGKRSSNLNQHINAAHSDEQYIKWYQCTKCSYRSKHSGHLERHKATHTYECEQCPFRTKNTSSLHKHVNSQHSDKCEIKWFQCDVCPYKAKRKFHLKRHVSARHLEAT